MTSATSNTGSSKKPLEIRYNFDAVLDIKYDKAAAKDWIDRTIIKARNNLNTGMRGPHSGNLYTVNGKPHIASAAGEFPASPSGALNTTTLIRIEEDEGEIGSNLEYAGFLQDGTSKMAARKLYKEALEMALEDTINDLDSILFITLRPNADNRDNR